MQMQQIARSGFYLAILVSVFISHTALAAFTFKGIVKDAEDGRPLAYAAIHLMHTGIGTSSNEKGEFAFTLQAGPADTLQVYLAGYSSYQLPVKGLKPDSAYTIALRYNAFELEEVLVQNIDGRALIQQVLDKMEKRQQAYMQEASFRQAYKWDDQYIKYAEASIAIYHPALLRKEESIKLLSGHVYGSTGYFLPNVLNPRNLFDDHYMAEVLQMFHRGYASLDTAIAYTSTLAGKKVYKLYITQDEYYAGRKMMTRCTFYIDPESLQLAAVDLKSDRGEGKDKPATLMHNSDSVVKLIPDHNNIFATYVPGPHGWQLHHLHAGIALKYITSYAKGRKDAIHHQDIFISLDVTATLDKRSAGFKKEEVLDNNKDLLPQLEALKDAGVERTQQIPYTPAELEFIEKQGAK